MLAGLNPAQGLIFMLQALGGGLISKDMAMRELPFTVNVTQELEKIEIEKMRDSLLGSITAYTQAIPQMAASGGDASEVVRKIAAVIKARQKGRRLRMLLKQPSLHSNKFLLLGKHLWLSNRPLLPPLLQQERSSTRKWTRDCRTRRTPKPL